MSVDTPVAAYATVRAAAARTVTDVAVNRRYLDNALSEARAHDPRLSPADSAMVQELAYGTLRWHAQLGAIANRLLHRPLSPRDADLLALLLVGLYQLRHQHLAESLVVDCTVEAAVLLGKPWAKGMLNACLRRAQRERAALDAWILNDPVRRYSHPQWLIDALRVGYPPAWTAVLDANNARPPLTVRVNTQRTTVADFMASVEATGTLDARAVASVPSAAIVEPPVAVERLPGFVQGLVSVQDAAAQLAAFMLDAKVGERVLDACAAPGGKAAHLCEHTPGLGELVALDTDERRLAQLRHNFERLGLRATVFVADAGDAPAWWDGRPFDRILLDAPCSATGVIRRHPDIKLRRQPDDLARLQATQARLLEALWPLLRPGGKLLYVTCSVLPAENEGQINAFLARHAEARCEQPDLALGRWTGSGLQILPGEQEMDGFYYALIGKQ